MRIISGKYRGKKLNLPKTKNIRPTQDRLKESLFNILQHHYLENILEQTILDAFAGSGSLGLECLSRGSNKAVFIDSSEEAINLLKTNINSLNYENNSIIIKGNSTTINLENLNLQFALVFLDPPYASTLIEESIKNLLTQNIFKKNCIFVTESNISSSNNEFHNEIILQRLELSITKHVGDNTFKIYRLLS